MLTVLAMGVGLFAGLHAAIWGAYKDAPHEGFTWRQFLRSPAIAMIAAPVVAGAARLDPRTGPGLVLLFAVTYAVERALAETYKTFFREQDQSRYTIPMQLAVFGRPVASRGWRALFGVGYAGIIVGGTLLAWWLQDRVGPWPRGIVALTVGALGGWFSAFGGAWKDAPIEGFQVLKFFRSPLLAAALAWVLLALTDSWPLVMLGAVGLTVACTETWKTFFFPSVPRGKFAGRPVAYPAVLGWRGRRLVPAYVGIWVVVAAGFLVGMG